MPTIPMDLVLIVIIALLIVQLVVSVKILSKLNGSTPTPPSTKKPAMKLTFDDMKRK